MISTSLYVQRIVLASHYIICTGSAFGQPAKGFESFLVSILERTEYKSYTKQEYILAPLVKDLKVKKERKKKREKQGKEVW